MTQCEAVLDYLETHPDGITQKEAINELGVYRLASRISDLKRAGVPIVSKTVTIKTQYGSTYIKRYSL